MSHLLKKVRSWFQEVIVESWNSPVHGKIDVSLVEGRYVLNAGNVNHSFGSLHRVFKQAMTDEAMKIIELSPVLLLGLGGGSVVHIMHHDWKYDVPITAIENDSAMIEAGRKYFHLEESDLLEIIQMDAAEYVNNCEQVFGLIIVDLFVDKEVPEAFEQENFIRKLSQMTNRPGMLMFNKIVHDNTSRSQSSHIHDHIARYYDEARVRRIKGKWENHVIIGEKPKND